MDKYTSDYAIKYANAQYHPDHSLTVDDLRYRYVVASVLNEIPAPLAMRVYDYIISHEKFVDSDLMETFKITKVQAWALIGGAK